MLLVFAALVGCDTSPQVAATDSFACFTDSACGLGFRCVSQKCRDATTCQRAEVCGDGADNDCNGLADCEDLACATACKSIDGGVDAGVVDAGAVDAGAVDAGAVDAGAVDAGAVDAGAVDAGSVDAGSVDAGAMDAGAVDAGAVDAGAVDAGAVDAGAVDAGAVDAGAVDAGAVDAGAADAGPRDAGIDSGVADAGVPPNRYAVLTERLDGGPVCDDGGWCWVTPWPFLINDFAIESPSTAWMVAASGVVARFNFDGGWDRTSIAGALADSVIQTAPNEAWFKLRGGGASRVRDASVEDVFALTDAGAMRMAASNTGDIWLYDVVTGAGFAFDNTSSRWVQALPAVPAGTCQDSIAVAPLTSTRALASCGRNGVASIYLYGPGMFSQLVSMVDGGAFGETNTLVADSDTSAVLSMTNANPGKFVRVFVDGGSLPLPRPGSSFQQAVPHRSSAPAGSGPRVLSAEPSGLYRLLANDTWQGVPVTGISSVGIAKVDDVNGVTLVAVVGVGVAIRTATTFAPVQRNNATINTLTGPYPQWVPSPNGNFFATTTDLWSLSANGVTAPAAFPHGAPGPLYTSSDTDFFYARAGVLTKQPMGAASPDSLPVPLTAPEGQRNYQALVGLPGNRVLATGYTSNCPSGVGCGPSQSCSANVCTGPMAAAPDSWLVYGPLGDGSMSVASKPAGTISFPTRLVGRPGSSEVWILDGARVLSVTLPSLMSSAISVAPLPYAADACFVSNSAGFVVSDGAFGLVSSAGFDVAPITDFVGRVVCDVARGRAFAWYPQTAAVDLRSTPPYVTPVPQLNRRSLMAIDAMSGADGATWVFVRNTLANVTSHTTNATLAYGVYGVVRRP